MNKRTNKERKKGKRERKRKKPKKINPRFPAGSTWLKADVGLSTIFTSQNYDTKKPTEETYPTLPHVRAVFPWSWGRRSRRWPDQSCGRRLGPWRMCLFRPCSRSSFSGRARHWSASTAWGQWSCRSHSAHNLRKKGFNTVYLFPNFANKRLCLSQRICLFSHSMIY